MPLPPVASPAAPIDFYEVTALWPNIAKGSMGGSGVLLPSLLFPPILGPDNRPMGLRLLVTAAIHQGVIGVQLIPDQDLPAECCQGKPLTGGAIRMSYWPAAFEPFPSDRPAWKTALSSGPQAVLNLLASGTIDSPAGLPLAQTTGIAVGLASDLLLRTAFLQLGATVSSSDSPLVLSRLALFVALFAAETGPFTLLSASKLLVDAARTTAPVLRAQYERALLLEIGDAPSPSAPQARRL